MGKHTGRERKKAVKTERKIEEASNELLIMAKKKDGFTLDKVKEYQTKNNLSSEQMVEVLQETIEDIQYKKYFNKFADEKELKYKRLDPKKLDAEEKGLVEKKNTEIRASGKLEPYTECQGCGKHFMPEDIKYHQCRGARV